MFRGHCNKSIHHCSVVQQGFGRTNRKVVPFLPGISPGYVDGGERGVEREGQSLLIAGLAVSEARELFGIAKDELQLESCPVDVKDISGGESEVGREEHLTGLLLFVWVQIVHDDYADLTAEAYRPDISRVQLKDEFAIHGVLFLEDAHVKVLEVNLPGKLLGTPPLLCLRATIEILEVHVITEAAYDVETQLFDPGNKTLLGEVGISHDEVADGQQLFAYAAQHPQIPARQGIGIFHPPGAFWLASTDLGSEGLLRFQEHGILGIRINNGESQDLQTVFDSAGASGPEPVYARSLLAGLGNEAGVDAYCDAVSHHRRKEVAVERQPVKGLLEVLAEPALTRAATPRHLGEVHASGGCKIKFHGLDDECSERFA